MDVFGARVFRVAWKPTPIEETSFLVQLGRSPGVLSVLTTPRAPPKSGLLRGDVGGLACWGDGGFNCRVGGRFWGR